VSHNDTIALAEVSKALPQSRIESHKGSSKMSNHRHETLSIRQPCVRTVDTTTSDDHVSWSERPCRPGKTTRIRGFYGVRARPRCTDTNVPSSHLEQALKLQASSSTDDGKCVHYHYHARPTTRRSAPIGVVDRLKGTDLPSAIDGVRKRQLSHVTCHERVVSRDLLV